MIRKSRPGKHHNKGGRRFRKAHAWAIAIPGLVLAVFFSPWAINFREGMGIRCDALEERAASGGAELGPVNGPVCSSFLAIRPEVIPDYAGVQASTTPLDPPTTAPAGGPVGEQAAP